MAPWARGVCWVCLNTTISAFCVRRKQAQKIAMLKAVADARGRRKTGGVARPCVRKLRPGHSCQSVAGYCEAKTICVSWWGGGGATQTPTQRAASPDENFAGTRLPAVLLHDAGLLHAPVVLVHDARRGLEEVFVKLELVRRLRRARQGERGREGGGNRTARTRSKPRSSTFLSSALSVRKLVSPWNSSRGSRLPSRSSSLTLVFTRPVSTRLVSWTASRRSRARTIIRSWWRSNSPSSASMAASSAGGGALTVAWLARRKGTTQS